MLNFLRRLFRRDGWENAYTGLGTSRDKTQMAVFLPGCKLADMQLTALFNEEDLAFRIISDRPKQMLRRGYEVKLEEEDATDLEKYAGRLGFNAKVREAMVWARLYGGSLLVMGIDDLQDPIMPLNEDRIRAVRYLTVVDRRYVYPVQWYSDPLDPKFGQPEVYRIQVRTSQGTQNIVYVHESRCIRFEGAETDVETRWALQGWSLSVLQRPYEVLRQFNQSFQSAGHLLSDASQGVIKLKGLFEQVAGGGKKALETRMKMLDMTRSSARALVLDESEDFKREPTSFSQIPDLLDRFMQRLAAATDTPVTILMGRSPAGMNATGESDFRVYYDAIQCEQTDELKPRLERFYGLLLKTQDSGVKGDPADLEVCFKPLWQPTEGETADVRLKVAQADNLYLTQGVVLAEEVALSRFGKGYFNMETEIDTDARERSLEAELEAGVKMSEAKAEADPTQMLMQPKAPPPGEKEDPSGPTGGQG